MIFSIAGNAGEYYQWTDNEGNVHFSDSLGAVPQEYQEQVKTGRFKESERDDQSPAPPPHEMKKEPAQPG
ncbi:MAG: DUF4124 domain-containing protein, partial [bacterium]